MKQLFTLITALVLAVLFNPNAAQAAKIERRYTHESNKRVDEYKAEIQTLELVQAAFAVTSRELEAHVAFEIARVTWYMAEACEVEAYDQEIEIGIALAEHHKDWTTAGKLRTRQETLLHTVGLNRAEAVFQLHDIEVQFPKYSHLGSVMLTLGRYLEAVEQQELAYDCYEKVVHDPTATLDERATSHVQIGTMFLNKQEYALAREEYGRVIREYACADDYGWALYYTALSYEMQEQWREAAAQFAEVLYYSVHSAGRRVAFTEDATIHRDKALLMWAAL